MIVHKPAHTQRIPHTRLRLQLACSLLALALPALMAEEVSLSWNPNPESNIEGYILHYGTVSGDLSEYRDVGKVTRATLDSLSSSTTYYFAVQAYNSSGLFSELSAEISHTTPAPQPTGVVLRNSAGTTLGGTSVLDLGMVRVGAVGESETFTVTNYNNNAISGLRLMLDGPDARNFMVQGLPQTVVVNPNGSFERGFSDWSHSGMLRFRQSAVATDGIIMTEFSHGEGPNDGVLNVSFPTDPGHLYELRFDLGLRSYNTNPQVMRTTVRGGKVHISNESTINGPGAGASIWQAKSFSFSADSTTTTLTFEDVSTTSSGLDLMLDHVRVIDVSASSASGGITLAAGASATFTVSYKPEASGTQSTSLRLVADNASGLPKPIEVVGTGSMTFEAWLDSYAATGGATGNPDGDPLDNQMEFAFGLDPRKSDSGALAINGGILTTRGTPTVRINAGTPALMEGLFPRRKDHQILGLTYRPQFSSDLVNWQDAAGQWVVVADGGDIEVVSIAAPATILGKPARFFRVGISRYLPSGFTEWLAHHEIDAQAPGTTVEKQMHYLMAYAFGMDPGSAATGTAVESRGMVVSRGKPNVCPPASPQDAFTGIFARRIDHATVGLVYQPQFSADLVNWQDASSEPVVLASDGEIEIVSVTAPSLINGRAARFFRVGVVRPSDP